MRTTDKIKTAIRIRLKMQIPYMNRWGEAMAIGALPQNLPYTMRTIALMLDDVWYMAGDRSTDMDWYTKRGLLGAVYAATELYMLTDKSPGFESSWEFLDRRLEEVSRASKLPHELLDTLSGVATFVTNTVLKRR
jgi:ubiquinone biosynthesis protein COQ9